MARWAITHQDEPIGASCFGVLAAGPSHRLGDIDQCPRERRCCHLLSASFSSGVPVKEDAFLFLLPLLVKSSPPVVTGLANRLRIG